MKQSTERGFTLVELLMVVAIIGILLGFLSGGIAAAIGNARRQRNRATITALELGIRNFFHDYDRWPCDRDITSGVETWRETNYEVFNRLLREHPDNPNGVAYLKTGSLIVGTAQGANRLTMDANVAKYGVNSAKPVLNPWGSPYKVTINLDKSTVSVSD